MTLRLEPKTTSVSIENLVSKYGKNKSVRDATSLGSAKQLLRALHVIEFIEDMIDSGKSSTLREIHYIRKLD